MSTSYEMAKRKIVQYGRICRDIGEQQIWRGDLGSNILVFNTYGKGNSWKEKTKILSKMESKTIAQDTEPHILGGQPEVEDRYNGTKAEVEVEQVCLRDQVMLMSRKTRSKYVM